MQEALARAEVAEASEAVDLGGFDSLAQMELEEPLDLMGEEHDSDGSSEWTPGSDDLGSEGSSSGLESDVEMVDDEELSALHNPAPLPAGFLAALGAAHPATPSPAGPGASQTDKEQARGSGKAKKKGTKKYNHRYVVRRDRYQPKLKDRNRKKKRAEKKLARAIGNPVQDYRPPRPAARSYSQPARIFVDADVGGFPSARGGHVGAGVLEPADLTLEDQRLENLKGLRRIYWDGE